jgi:hypothetical protein
MFTELLLKECPMDANRPELAKYIVDGVARMSALLDGLHAFAIGGTGEPRNQWIWNMSPWQSCTIWTIPLPPPVPR